jgi:ABC-type nitrate/sulfonate/bicarbonate transport system ATPase subunit
LARKRAIGYVPQDLAFFPHLTVGQNITYGTKLPATALDLSREKLCSVLEIDRLLEPMPASLSGGEKQRVALRGRYWPLRHFSFLTNRSKIRPISLEEDFPQSLQNNTG